MKNFLKITLLFVAFLSFLTVNAETDNILSDYSTEYVIIDSHSNADVFVPSIETENTIYLTHSYLVRSLDADGNPENRYKRLFSEAHKQFLKCYTIDYSSQYGIKNSSYDTECLSYTYYSKIRYQHYNRYRKLFREALQPLYISSNKNRLGN